VAPDQAQRTTAGSRPLRILVVDDLKDSADTLAIALQDLGHRIEVAYDGEHALRAAATAMPEVILLDLGMPKLDGYEVCRRIRAQPGAGTC
jgi:CheY-like chemotaxis protein